jgi:hypothetical protein
MRAAGAHSQRSKQRIALSMPSRPTRFPLLALTSASLFAVPHAAAQLADAPAVSVAAQQLAPVLVQGNYLNSVGSTDAASAGTVSAKLIESRPTLRPAELLEFIPGVIVTQHSGDGKANQYFLRGFNLDHGTDFATFVDGMPVNMPTHAHGHGYSDLNWLIPELVERIRYRKGPYHAEEGDFASAGSARFGLFDVLPRGQASLTLGANGYRRGLLADSTAWAGADLLYAIELARNDGPWDNPEKFHRANGVLRLSFGDAASRQSITAMAYGAGWNATDQIPLRAVQSGTLGRFGTIDPSDGGRTARYSLSYRMDRTDRDGALRVDAFAIQSRLDLYSNFTYQLEHPADLGPALNPGGIDGDQFEQAEVRRVFGLQASRSWNLALAGRETTHTVGVQVRHDRIDPVGLYATVERRRAATTQESRVRQTGAALWAESSTQWTPWLRSVVGLRADRFDFAMSSSIAANSGKARATLVSPKATLVFGPWARTEYFVNYGQGFHSNDARGATATVTPKEGLPTQPVTPLVRSRGAELGLRTEIVPGLQSSLALWRLDLDSELVFSGDAGDTEPSRASRRYGVEWNNHYAANPWLLLDADIAVSRSRYTDAEPSGPRIPGAIETVASIGATVHDHGRWSGPLQWRYFGPRALTEDGSRRSQGTTLTYLRVGYRFTQDVRVALDVFNLFDRGGNDIDYYYASRLRGEPPGGVEDLHFHPVEPRSVRLTLTAAF